MDPSAISVAQLCKRYGTFLAVDRLDLEVPPGTIYALLGPNGAGKTTTLRMLTGILQPSAGAARIAGHDCFAARAEVMRHAGYLPDEPTFYDYLRGAEVLRFVGEMHGLSRADLAARSARWVERLDLGDALGEFAINYSKGMKKKLALACALLHEPAVLLLDEPTNGLDPYATRTLHQIVREQAAAGRTVLFSTHLLDQAERLCHEVGILFQGRLAAHGTIAALRARCGDDKSLEEIFFAVTGGDASPGAGPDA